MENFLVLCKFKKNFMKPKLLFLSVSLSFILSNCQKQNAIQTNLYLQDPFADSAIQFLKSNLTNEDFSGLSLKTIRPLLLNGKTVAVKIYLKIGPKRRFIMLHKDGNAFLGNWIDLSALNSEGLDNYKGSIELQNINNSSK